MTDTLTGARCPACGAAVRAGADWCTLCWTDLRPAPPPAVAAPPAPLVVAPVPVAAVPATPSAPALDPLTAPLGIVLGEEPAAVAAPAPTGVWPCLACGARTPIDLDTCHECGLPFGGKVPGQTSRAEDERNRRRWLAIGGVLAFLLVLGLYVFLATPAPADPASPTTPVEVVRE